MFRYLPQLTGLAAVAVGYTTVHKHTFGSRLHWEKVALFKEDDKPFDETTQIVVDELTDYFLLRLDPADINRLKFFWIKGMDTDHFGTHMSRLGSFVGVPLTFQYQSRSDVDLSSLANCGMSITENNPQALESLTESLVLSENAKRFAIATELHGLESMYVMEKISFLLCILCAYQNGEMMSGYTTRKSKSTQLLCLLALASAWLVFYYLLEGSLSVRRTKKTDAAAAKMSSDCLAGGIEYFSKLQQRNIALRTLLENGSQTYTDKGDIIRKWFEIPFMSLSERKEALVKLKTNLSKNEFESF